LKITNTEFVFSCKIRATFSEISRMSTKLVPALNAW